MQAAMSKSLKKAILISTDIYTAVYKNTHQHAVL